MYRNYITIALRSLMKTPTSSFINLFGLAVAIGICLVVYVAIAFDYRIDSFHEHKDDVYLATFWADRDGTEKQYGMTPRPLGERLQEDFTQIKAMCRVEDRSVVLKYQDNVFHEQVRFTDAAFLKMFTFPLKWGTSGSLADANSIILSEAMSVKYFGEENPVGQDLKMIFGEARSKVFTVAGVAAPFPEARTIDFSFLVNFDNIRQADPGYDAHRWPAFVGATFIQVEALNDVASIIPRMEEYRQQHNQADQDWAITSFAFEPLSRLHERSVDIENDISYGVSSDSHVVLSLIGLFILMLACFNYVNIAIVSAARRLKEIGVRKVIGASRGRIIFQFLAENVIITLLALLLGVVLASTLFIPWFSELSHTSFSLSLADTTLWVFLLLMILLTGLVSGVYPAFYISTFKATTIFKGSVRFGKKNPLTKMLLGFQLVLACILMTGAVVFTQNTAYQAQRSWGYDQQSVLYATIPEASAYAPLKTALLQAPHVVSVSGSHHHVGLSDTLVVIQHENRPYEVQQLSVSTNYLTTMGISLAEGRSFNEQSEADQQALLVNETLVNRLGLSHPVGHPLKVNGVRYEIIGVVKDFHSYDFQHAIPPLVLRVADEAQYQYVSARVKPGAEKEAYQYLQAQWATLLPEIPFRGGYQDDVFSGYFMGITTEAKFFKAVSLIAILLAGLGVYGLVTLNVAGRVKEFSIRKVLGAEVHHVAATIVRQYFILFSVAILIGAPVSYWLAEQLIGISSSSAYHVPVGYGGVALSVAILVGVLLSVVVTQVSRVVKSNLVAGLKAE